MNRQNIVNWRNRKIQGTEYRFEHLQPFVLPLNGYRINVSFGAHTFTRAPKPADTPDLVFMDGKTMRTFCSIRHGHSRHLPAALVSAAQGPVFQSGKKLIFKASLPGLAGPYMIPCELRKSPSPKYDAKMQVNSAYHRPKHPKTMPRANFADVLEAVINGDNIIWTKK